MHGTLLAVTDRITQRSQARRQRYLDQLGSFEKNRFDLSAETVETVNRHWGFAFDAFGYERLDPREVAAQAEPDGAGSTV